MSREYIVHDMFPAQTDHLFSARMSYCLSHSPLWSCKHKVVLPGFIFMKGFKPSLNA